VRVIIAAQHIGEESNDPGWFVADTERIQNGLLGKLWVGEVSVSAQRLPDKME
jgi:hypothetical protein